jgi:DNA-binding response OmpR family regulator
MSFRPVILATSDRARRPDAITINVKSRVIYFGDDYGGLTFSRIPLLIVESLLVRRGRPISTDELTEYFWGEDEDGGPLDPRGLIASHLCRVRKDLASVGLEIKNDYKLRYWLIDHAASRQAMAA